MEGAAGMTADAASLAIPPQSAQGASADAGAASSDEQLELEVRWMTSGATACCFRASPKLHVAELKASVQAHAGIPAGEQRLFWSGGSEELDGDVELRAAPCGVIEVTAAAGESRDAPAAGEAPREARAVLLVRCVSDPRVTDLGCFRAAESFAALPSGDFTKVRKLGDGINGDIMLYKWQRDGGEAPVAVKMLRSDSLEGIWGTETDERLIHVGAQEARKAPDAEDALTEIGILSYLSRQADLPQSFLRMLDVFVGGGFTWLVTEYAEGGELFDVAASGSTTPAQCQRHVFDLLQAVAYLHRHHIGHRDVSLENVLLRGGRARLMDFGMAVRSHSASGTPLRYFRAVGKEFYRSPECYVPRAAETLVKVPDGAKDGDVILAQTDWGGDTYLCEVRLPSPLRPCQSTCKADVWGYTTAPADVWAVAICLFILGFQCPPWNWAMLDDQSFAYVHGVGDGALEAVLRNWGKPLLHPEAMRLLTGMLRSDPAQRLSAAECLESAWFEELASAPEAAGACHKREVSAGGCAEAGVA